MYIPIDGRLIKKRKEKKKTYQRFEPGMKATILQL